MAHQCCFCHLAATGSEWHYWAIFQNLKKKKNETEIIKQNIESNNELNKQIKATIIKEIKQDLALMGYHRAQIKN